MRRFAILLIVTCMALAGLVLPASATHCDGPYTSFSYGYLDVRHVADDEALYSVWVFAESNGVAGLQRGGYHISGIRGVDDDAECRTGALGDAVIF